MITSQITEGMESMAIGMPNLLGPLFSSVSPIFFKLYDDNCWHNVLAKFDTQQKPGFVAFE